MKIDSVDFFYVALPEVRDIGDGSQDALLVRVTAGNCVGWGECEASPLVSIAAWNCPMSHSACKPLAASVLGQRLDEPSDIPRINRLVRANSFDLLQADHTLSGIDVALWDLLGKRYEEPTYRLLGYTRAYPKLAYASQLFGDTPDITLARAKEVAANGYRAAKFGWGPYGRGTVQEDEEQVVAAREGLGKDLTLLVDAGTVWGDDVEVASKRLSALRAQKALWLEEPFESGAIGAYHELARQSRPIHLAGGEGCHNFHQAKNLIDYGAVGFIQIDAGRIGGLTTAKLVADYAYERGIRYVNHTFTSALALSASLQPYAGLEKHEICEYPCALSPLASELTTSTIAVDRHGYVRVPESPGLGIEPSLSALEKYLVAVEIKVSGKKVFKSVTPR